MACTSARAASANAQDSAIGARCLVRGTPFGGWPVVRHEPTCCSRSNLRPGFLLQDIARARVGCRAVSVPPLTQIA